MITIIAIVILVIGGLIAWVSNRTIKKSLSSKLGRNVKDHEVTSLTAWMNADDKK